MPSRAVHAKAPQRFARKLLALFTKQLMKEATPKETGFTLKLAEEPAPDMMSICAVVFGLMGLLLKVC